MSKPLKNTGVQNEQDFLSQYDPCKYDLLSASVDNVVFSIDSRIEENNYRKLDEQKLMVLLIKRKEHPYMGRWSLPGGFIEKNETLEEAAIRVLNVKTGLENLYLEQLYTFGKPDRDPRMRIISCAYMSLIDRSTFTLKSSQEDYEISWFEVRLSENNGEMLLKSDECEFNIPINKAEIQNGRLQTVNYDIQNESPLAFDHASIILEGLLRLRGKIEYSDIVFNLVPDVFTITQLQHIYEIILGHKLLAPAFRRKIEYKLVGTSEFTHQKGHRPSQYFKYKSDMEVM